MRQRRVRRQRAGAAVASTLPSICLVTPTCTSGECPSGSGPRQRWTSSQRNLHGVDLHPFAAFLTTVNVLFLLMPIYAKAREKNPDYSLDLQVFSSDSLEKHDRDLLAPDLFTKLNARVQLTEESFHRYQEMLKKRFDRVFGNPPWGGVLKGPLAPVYDEIKKKRFAEEYPAAAQGKYDVYGLVRRAGAANPQSRWPVRDDHAGDVPRQVLGRRVAAAPGDKSRTAVTSLTLTRSASSSSTR